MFSKVTRGSSRQLACPECGNKPEPAFRARGQVIACERCQTKASVAEWASAASEPRFVGRADEMPVTNIRRENTPGGTVWEIPARGKFGFFMVFGILWCLITGLVSGGFLVTVLTGGKIEGNMPEWLLIPFFGLFWIVGLAMLYAGIREKWLKHRLSVEAGELVLRREMFGRHRDKRFAVADIRSVEQREFYQQNYQAVYGIEVKASRGKLRFGSSLTPEEKAWLVADLRGVVFGPGPELASPAVSGQRSKHFSLEIPTARKHLWPLAIMLTVIGVAFIFVGFKFLDEHPFQRSSGEPAFFAAISTLFDLLSRGFQGIWLFFAAAMALGGVVLASYLFRERNNVRKIEGNDSEISLRTYRHGRVWKEKVYPRHAVTDIRASISGNSNGKSMKRLELIVGDKAEKLAGWIDGEAADALVTEVRAGL